MLRMLWLVLLLLVAAVSVCAVVAVVYIVDVCVVSVIVACCGCCCLQKLRTTTITGKTTLKVYNPCRDLCYFRLCGSMDVALSNIPFGCLCTQTKLVAYSAPRPGAP